MLEPLKNDNLTFPLKGGCGFGRCIMIEIQKVTCSATAMKLPLESGSIKVMTIDEAMLKFRIPLYLNTIDIMTEYRVCRTARLVVVTMH